MVTYSTRLSDVEWGEFLKLLGGNSNTSSQNTNGTSPSGNNSTYSNNSQQIAYLDELTNIQSRLNRGLEDLILDINQKRSDIKKQYQTYEKDEKDIAKKKKDLERALTQNERANNKLHDSKYKEFLDTRNKQIRAELSLLNETEKYNKTKAKLYYKELETDATRTRIREKNYTHEQELEQKRLEFQEKHLEKTQAIAKKELEVQQTKQEWELKGYNKSGKKHSGAEIFSAIGKASAYFKGNSGDRIAGDAVSKITNLGAKAVNFLSNDKKASITDVGNVVAGIADNFGPIGKSIGGIARLVAAIIESYDKINAASSKYARSVGGGLAKMEQMKVDAVGVADSINKWGGNAYKFEEIMQHLSELSEKTGRVMDHMSEMDIKSLEDLTRHGITSDVLNQYDTFGLSMERIDERVASIYKTSGKHGLNAKAVTDTVNKNLKMAQQYTFAGGQRALERMAEKAVALKYNMESVARFADKVSTLEGAAQSAASLSVLGGDFARMANPLSLLYGGLQDPERLNEMMLNMTKNMAHWDTQTNELRITGENRMRLRQAAEAMGVSYEDLINQSYSQGRRRMIDRELDKTGKFNDDETREYIRNLAQLDENGRAYIRFSGEEKKTYLDEMGSGAKERLRKESEAMEQKDKAKIGDIYMETRTLTDKLNDYIQWFRTKFFDVILKIAGYGDEEKAKIKGLDVGNAKFYDQMSDDYYYAGMSEEGLQKIKTAFGLDEKNSEYQKIKNREWTQDEFDSWLTNQIMRIQTQDKKTYNNGQWVERVSETDINKKAYGGIIRGKGTSKSDSIPAWLSNGEFVVNASATSKHLPELQAMNAEGFSSGTITPIRAGKNQYNLGTSVLPPMSMSNVGVGGVQHVTIDPLQVSGTLTLNVAGGGSKTINANELFTQENVNILLRKLQESLGFRLDKTEFRMPKFM